MTLIQGQGDDIWDPDPAQRIKDPWEKGFSAFKVLKGLRLKGLEGPGSNTPMGSAKKQQKNKSKPKWSSKSFDSLHRFIKFLKFFGFWQYFEKKRWGIHPWRLAGGYSSTAGTRGATWGGLCGETRKWEAMNYFWKFESEMELKKCRFSSSVCSKVLNFSALGNIFEEKRWGIHPWRPAGGYSTTAGTSGATGEAFVGKRLGIHAWRSASGVALLFLAETSAET